MLGGGGSSPLCEAILEESWTKEQNSVRNNSEKIDSYSHIIGWMTMIAQTKTEVQVSLPALEKMDYLLLFATMLCSSGQNIRAILLGTIYLIC